jgi:hypothetical protein
MSNSIKFYGDPISRSFETMRTPRQLGALNRMEMYEGVDVEGQCKAIFGCEVAMLSARAASFLIGYLKGQA